MLCPIFVNIKQAFTITSASHNTAQTDTRKSLGRFEADVADVSASIHTQGYASLQWVQKHCTPYADSSMSS